MKETWGVIVIGGGPAGMMTAGRAAEQGAKVILIEKNETLGKKLLTTGGGRCNVTNAEFDTRKLLEKFKEDGKFLFSAFSQWNVKETLDFFNTKGMETKVEAGLRVFPTSNMSQSVLNVLTKYIKDGKVTLLTNSAMAEFVMSDDKKKIIGVKLKNKKIVLGKSIIIATGGTSRPETGSTGDAYKWLKNIGHTVIEPTPSLVPIATKDAWISKLSGVSLADIKLTVFQNGQKQNTNKGLSASRRSKILFTHVGLSGPTILNMSKDIGELLKYGEVTISLDLLPLLDYSKLNTKLQEIFTEKNNMKFKNSLAGFIPSAIVPIVVELSKIDPEKKTNSVTREERLQFVKLLKDIPIHVDKLLGIEKAIISSGGVILDEVDFKTMRSRIFPNLYLVGDILNIDRPSGGYSLQLCWTTGFVAGTHCAKNI
ncbi:MAG: NAD(P)/FAD-dependent oxidoreductase [Candidatus Paceibacterota bacterium]